MAPRTRRPITEKPVAIFDRFKYTNGPSVGLRGRVLLVVEMRGTSSSMESAQELAEVNAARVRRGADAIGI